MSDYGTHLPYHASLPRGAVNRSMIVDMLAKLLLETESLFEDAALRTGPTSVLTVRPVTR